MVQMHEANNKTAGSGEFAAYANGLTQV